MRKILMLASALAATPSFAATNLLVNGSFEQVVGPLSALCPEGGATCRYTAGEAPTGWTGAGAYGLFQTGNLYTSYPDGQTVAFTNIGTLSQTVSGPVVAGTLYKLSGFIGLRSDFPELHRQRWP